MEYECVRVYVRQCVGAGVGVCVNDYNCDSVFVCVSVRVSVC